MKNLVLEELSLEQKIGLITCARRIRHNAEEKEEILEAVRRHAVGCVQLTPNGEAASYIAELRAAADYPLLIVDDMEQGYRPSGLEPVFTTSLAACRNAEYSYVFGAATAASARAAGYTGTWGPVVDCPEEDKPCLMHRVFGDDPADVTRNARAILQAFADNGFSGCCKHYPSAVDFPLDTHMAEGYSDYSKRKLYKHSLKPYLTLLKENAYPTVMTDHTVCRRIDPEYPASLSPKVIGILRKAGFDGLIYTDSLAMSGILQKYGEGHAMGLAVAAGNDVILPNYRTPYGETLRQMREEYDKGTFTEERLNDAVRHILNEMARTMQTPKKPYTVTEKTAEIFRAVSRDCITAINDRGVDAALPDPGKKRLFVVLTPQDFRADVVSNEISVSRWYYPERVAARIKEDFPNAEVVYYKEFSNASENDLLLTAAVPHDEVVFVTFCVTAAYLGTDCLTRRTEAMMEALRISGKLKTIVHFGNPFALETAPHVERRIFGYYAPDSQDYAIDVLAGKIPAKGTMPFHPKLR